MIDLPPGTGDTQLTLAQKVPVSGAIIVTTPQDIALLDARKGFKMFEKVEVPVLGIVENMSIHICSQCGHEEHIFGEGGGRRMAEQRWQADRRRRARFAHFPDLPRDSSQGCGEAVVAGQELCRQVSQHRYPEQLIRAA